MKRLSLFVISFFLLSSTIVLMQSDVVLLPSNAEVLEVRNTTYYINDTTTINDRDVIFENCTIVLNADLYIYDHNVTMKDVTVLANPSGNNQRIIRIYGTTLPCTVHIENFTGDSSNTYTWFGMWFEGRYLHVLGHNITMKNFYEFTLKEINTVDISNYDAKDGHGSRYTILGEHDVNDKSVYGDRAIIRNFTVHYFLVRTEGSSSYILENGTFNYLSGDGWGTTILRNVNFETASVYLNKGTIYIYQLATVHLYGLESVTIKDADAEYTVTNNSQLYLHTWNVYAVNTYNYLNVTASNGDLSVILPETNPRDGEIDIYIEQRNNTLNAYIPHTAQTSNNNTTNTTGAVSVPDEETVDYVKLILKIILAFNGLILLILIAIAYTVVWHRRRRR